MISSKCNFVLFLLLALGFQRFIYIYYSSTCYHSVYSTEGAFDLPLLLEVSRAFNSFIIALLALSAFIGQPTFHIIGVLSI